MDFTYKLNRKCLHCGKPIADQVHASRKYCPRIALEGGGGVLSCKDDFNTKVNRPLNQPYKYFTQCHKGYHKAIKALLEHEGDKVTIELINRYGINLYRPFEFKITKERRYVFYYHEF